MNSLLTAQGLGVPPCPPLILSGAHRVGGTWRTLLGASWFVLRSFFSPGWVMLISLWLESSSWDLMPSFCLYEKVGMMIHPNGFCCWLWQHVLWRAWYIPIFSVVHVQPHPWPLPPSHWESPTVSSVITFIWSEEWIWESYLHSRKLSMLKKQQKKKKYPLNGWFTEQGCVKCRNIRDTKNQLQGLLNLRVFF